MASQRLERIEKRLCIHCQCYNATAGWADKFVRNRRTLPCFASIADYQSTTSTLLALVDQTKANPFRASPRFSPSAKRAKLISKQNGPDAIPDAGLNDMQLWS